MEGDDLMKDIIFLLLFRKLTTEEERKKIIRDLINGLGCAIVGAALACLILALILLKG